VATAERWYFAYGSNLSKPRMQNRTGPILASRVARLKDHRLCFNNTDKEGIERYANIVPSAGAVTWGVAYWCSAQAMAALDRYEGVAEDCYLREWVEVETIDGDRLQAEVYIGGQRFTVVEGRPSDWYLDIILLGAKEHGLPEDYIRGIESLAKRPE
jgi:gamma-glutamylcyclotransferase